MQLNVIIFLMFLACYKFWNNGTRWQDAKIQILGRTESTLQKFCRNLRSFICYYMVKYHNYIHYSLPLLVSFYRLLSKYQRKKLVVCYHLELCADYFPCFLKNSCRIPVGYQAQLFSDTIMLAKPESVHRHKTCWNKKNKYLVTNRILYLHTGLTDQSTPGKGGVEGNWVNFCWVYAAGLSDPLPHYILFCGQL